MSSTRAAKTTAKRPDSQPFDFNLDAQAPPRPLTSFVFHWKGRRWTMRHIDELNVWDVVEAAEGGDMSAMTGTFRLGLGKDWETFRDMALPQWRFKALFTAYRKHCRYTVDGQPVDDGDTEQPEQPDGAA